MTVDSKRCLQTLCVAMLFIAPALAGDEPAAILLCDAKRLLECGNYHACWKKLDLVRSNYPAYEPQVVPLMNRLDGLVVEAAKSGRISIATWPEGKSAAVSLSFDDGRKTAYTIGAKGLEDYGWRGTFYLHCAGIGSNTVLWQDAQRNAHEIGCHSRTHPMLLSTLSEDTIRDEILGCDGFLEAHISTDAVWTFAYPHSDAGDKDGPLRRMIRSEYLVARTGHAASPYNPAAPSETDVLISFRALSSTPLSHYTKAVDDAIADNAWLIYMFHGFDHDGWEPVSTATWNGCMTHLDSVSNQIWVAPVLTIARYIECRKRAETAWCIIDDQTLEVSVSCPGFGTHLTPLTVSVRVPAAWTEVALSDRPDLLTVRQSHVTFELRPDGQAVKITKR